MHVSIPADLRDELVAICILNGFNVKPTDTITLTIKASGKSEGTWPFEPYQKNLFNPQIRTIAKNLFNPTKEQEQMTKSELIDSIAEKTKVSKISINCVIKSLIDCINTQEKIVLPGLGTFKHVTRPARTARNPTTGEAVNVEEKIVLKFKATKS